MLAEEEKVVDDSREMIKPTLTVFDESKLQVGRQLGDELTRLE